MMEAQPNEPAPGLKTSDKKSFAYVTVKDRWPPLVTATIDDVHRTAITSKDDAFSKEGREIVAQLGALKYEIQHDRQMTALADDGGDDIEQYNERLKTLGNPKWFDVEWMFAECYLYRRIHTYFALSKHWQRYDVFARSKNRAFTSSLRAILELAARYRTLITELESKSKTGTAQEDDPQRTLFIEMCEICLRGNATDLSLLPNLSHEDVEKMQGKEAREKAEKSVLVNDLAAAYKALDALRTSQKKPVEDRRIDIVLDNAGFELYVDLLLAGFLLASGLTTSIVLHPKSIPWFVSDVTPTDFATLLSALADPTSFFKPSPDNLDDDPATSAATSSSAAALLTPEAQSNLSFLFTHLSTLHSEGSLLLRPNPFWTSSYNFWPLPRLAPRLFSDFQDSALVIFKGDLNYRKLTADAAWDPTTPFAKAIGPLGQSGSGVRVLALRTAKSDPVVGLRAGVDEELRRGQGKGDMERREWAWSGQWGFCQFADGKAS